MICREIIQEIEKVYPKSAALGFDNVGLLAGRMNKEVKQIYVALDATEEVIQHAIEAKADLLITHHPLIFSPLKSVTDEDFVSRRILTLIQHDISYYAMHTNYDVLGMAALVEQKLYLHDTEVLDVTMEMDEQKEGIGRIGNMEHAMSLQACCQFVKFALGVDHVKVFGDLDQTISKMAVCPGSGKSVIGEAIAKGAHVLVTGDIGHHDGLDAVEQGLCIIDAGHYGTEYMFLDDIEKFLKEHFATLDFTKEPVKMPFQII